MNYSGEGFEDLRHKMVKDQLLGRDIRDKKILDVFGKVPRHRFIDPAMYDEAYGDFPVSIGKGQTISQPYMVAFMVQLLNITEGDKVLEIGTGSGYETAILAELAGEVFSVERIGILADKARHSLQDFGYKNIRIKVDDGTLGWQEFAPFNKIVVTASSLSIPSPLLDQLSKGGKMVMPVGSRFTQRLILLEKSEQGRVSEKYLCGCVFVPLIGRYGWEDSSAGSDI